MHGLTVDANKTAREDQQLPFKVGKQLSVFP
jgi:hypothetical protein